MSWDYLRGDWAYDRPMFVAKAMFIILVTIFWTTLIGWLIWEAIA